MVRADQLTAAFQDLARNQSLETVYAPAYPIPGFEHAYLIPEACELVCCREAGKSGSDHNDASCRPPCLFRPTYGCTADRFQSSVALQKRSGGSAPRTLRRRQRLLWDAGLVACGQDGMESGHGLTLIRLSTAPRIARAAGSGTPRPGQPPHRSCFAAR